MYILVSTLLGLSMKLALFYNLNLNEMWVYIYLEKYVIHQYIFMSNQYI
jgi:hypothetical protein